MRAMKDSGVEWIGEIPEAWEVRRLKYCASMYTGNSIKDEEKNLYEDPEDAYPYISSKDIDLETNSADYANGMYVKHTDKRFKIAPNGSTLMCIEGGSAGRKKVLLNEDVAFVNKLCCFVPISIFGKFLYYYLNSPDFEDVFRQHISGMIGGVSVSNLERFPVPIPTAAEQQRIAAYLDEQCGEIDKVLAKTRESIEEYKKLKQSVITEAVTKGIRPNRLMKPSGIEWIGDIPEEWEVRPFRTILTERNEKNLPAKTEERLSLSIDLGVTKYAEKTTNLDRFKEDVTQYKLAYPGDLVMNSMNMIVGAVGVSPYFGCVSPAYYTYYDKSSSGVAARFCDFLFRTRIMRRVLRSLGKGIYSIERGDDRVNTCRLKVAREDLRALKIPLPSETEQTEIVAYLDQQCAEIDRLIAKKEQIITELESYKKSLIYECVTGKREVAEKRNLVDIFGKTAKMAARAKGFSNPQLQKICDNTTVLAGIKTNFAGLDSIIRVVEETARTQRILGDISRMTTISQLPPLPKVPDGIMQSTHELSKIIEVQRKMFDLPPLPKVPDSIMQSTRRLTQMIEDQRKMLQPFQANFNSIAQMLRSTAAAIGPLASLSTIHRQIAKDWDAIWKNIRIPVKPEIRQKKRAAYKRWAEFGWSCHPNIEFSEIPPESSEIADQFVMQELENYGVDKFIEELSQMVVPNQNEDFESAVFNFKHGYFRMCARVIFSLIDREFIIRQPKAVRPNGKPKQRELAKGAAEIFRKTLDEPETAEKILNRVPRFFYRCENMFYAVITIFESANDFRDEDKTVGLNRNFVDHGMSQRQATKKHCLQLFLLYYNVLGLFSFFDHIWPIKDERWLPTEKNDAESGRDEEDSE